MKFINIVKYAIVFVLVFLPWDIWIWPYQVLLRKDVVRFIGLCGATSALAGGALAWLLLSSVPRTYVVVGLLLGGAAGVPLGRWFVSHFEEPDQPEEPSVLYRLSERLGPSIPLQLLLFFGVPVAFCLLIYLTLRLLSSLLLYLPWAVVEDTGLLFFSSLAGCLLVSGIYTRFWARLIKGTDE
jgi:hypothetical protein